MRTTVALGVLSMVAFTAGCGAAPGGEDVGSSGSDVVSCPSTTVEGVDVSYYQGTIDWAQVKASGREFAFARVSDGTGFMDPQFDSYWAGIKAAGMVRGVYQFFRPEDDATAQADIVVGKVGSLGAGDLPPVLDVEVTDGQSSASIVSGIETWAARIRSQLGVDPIVYTAPGFWDGVTGSSKAASATMLWVANWGVSCPSLPAGWKSFGFWQYTDSGSVPGIAGSNDLDRFDGTLSDLQALAGGGGSGSSSGGSSGGSGSGGGGGSSGGSSSGSSGGSGSGSSSGGGGSSGNSSGGSAGCASSTLDTTVASGVCVQAASDEQWYECDSGSWVSGDSNCSVKYAWCHSDTLGKDVPPRACVQSTYDQVWYQCTQNGWESGVSNGAGPLGTCASMYSL